MNFTTDPRIGAVVSLALVVAGGFMVAAGGDTSAAWGWLLLVVGLLGVVANVGIYLRMRDR